jgi:hypothetical protein
VELTRASKPAPSATACLLVWLCGDFDEPQSRDRCFIIRLNSRGRICATERSARATAEADHGRCPRSVQTINSDKVKLRAYCDFGKVMEQIDRAGQRKDTYALTALSTKANNLAQQLGPDYIGIMQGLNDVDPNSAEGRRVDTLFEPIARQCNKG